MKKLLLTLCFVIVFVVFALNVRATGNASDAVVIHDIEEFSVDENYVSFVGWAFILNYHNNYDGNNAVITITAKNGKGGTVVAQEATDEQFDSKLQNEGAAIKKDTSLNMALYLANCYKKNNENRENYTSDQSCVQSYNEASCELGVAETSCHYDNAHFTAKFDTKKLIENLGTDSDIYFEIKISINQSVTKDTNIAVWSGAVTGDYDNGFRVTIQNEEKNVGVEIKSSSTARIRVSNGRVLDFNEHLKHMYGSTFKWKKDGEYEISARNVHDDYDNLNLYELKYGLPASNKTECSSSSYCTCYATNRNNNSENVNGRTCQSSQHSTKGIYINGNPIPGGSGSTGYAMPSWLTVDGKVILKFTSEDSEEVPRRCDSEHSNDPNMEECADEINYYQVKNADVDVSFTVTNNDTSYSALSKKSDSEKGNCSKNLDVDVTSKVSITQEGTATFYKSFTSDIYGGGGFVFEPNYVGKASYEICDNSLNYSVSELYAVCPSKSFNYNGNDLYEALGISAIGGRYYKNNVVLTRTVNSITKTVTFCESSSAPYPYTCYEYYYGSSIAGSYSYSSLGAKCNYTLSSSSLDSSIHNYKSYDNVYGLIYTYSAANKNLCESYYKDQGYSWFRPSTNHVEGCYKTDYGYSKDSTSVDYLDASYSETQTSCATTTSSISCTYNDCTLKIKNEFEKEMALSYLVETSDLKDTSTGLSVSAKTEVNDPNDATADNETYINYGTWKNDYEKLSSWAPNTEISYTQEFVKPYSCINRYTAEVTYDNSLSCDDDEIDGEGKIFIPLKQSSTKKFKYRVNLQKLSMITIMSNDSDKWYLSYECGLNCDQRLYDDSSGQYKFIYRPIDLQNAFPTTVNSGRLPGTNWEILVADTSSYTELVTDGRKDSDKIEYTVILTPDRISQLKTATEYNKYTYNDMSSIDLTGKSEILDDLILDGFATRSSTLYYNALGECTNQCWNPE